jgi:hypothetical protein
MFGNLNPSARVSVAGVIAPANQAAGTVTSQWVDMQAWFALLALLNIGAMAAGGTIDAKIEQATDAAGTGVKDVPGSAIVQVTQAGAGANTLVEINLRQDDLDRNNDFRFVRLNVAAGAAASFLSGVLLGFDARYGAATDNDIAAVAQTVS